MQPTFDDVGNEMFYILGKLSGMLGDPDLVDKLTKAVTDPLEGRSLRAHLLKTHDILAEVLAAPAAAFPTSH